MLEDAQKELDWWLKHESGRNPKYYEACPGFIDKKLFQ